MPPLPLHACAAANSGEVDDDQNITCQLYGHTVTDGKYFVGERIALGASRLMSVFGSEMCYTSWRGLCWLIRGFNVGNPKP